MPTIVSDVSVARVPQSQSAGSRSQDGTEQAASPFSELLEGCEAVEPETADAAAKPAEGKTAETAPSPDKAEKTEADGSAKAAEGESADVVAELALVIAAATQQAAPAEGEAAPAEPVEAVPGQVQPDADAAQTDAASADAPVPAVAQPAAPAATPVPAAAPALETVIASTPADAETLPAAAPAATETKPAAGVPVTEVKPETAPQGEPAGTVASPAPAATKQSASAAETAPTTPAKLEAKAEAGVEPAIATPETPADAEAAPKIVNRAPDMSVQAGKPAADAADPQSAMMTGAQPSADAAGSSTTLAAPVGSQAAAPNAAQPMASQPAPRAETVQIPGLAVEIAAQAQNGKNHFEIRLDPPELGRIEVRLHVDSEGQVTSHLRVERADTLDMLRRDAPQLERALQNAGLKTSDNGLQFSLRDQAFSQQNQGHDAPTTARIVMPDETLKPVETQRHYARLAGLGSGVDIRV